MENKFYFTFPGGARKAVTLSFDDGTVHDRRLVETFNRHGLKATFNLVPGRFGRDGVVSRDEVASLYEGHEIASHGWMHLNLDRLFLREFGRPAHAELLRRRLAKAKELLLETDLPVAGVSRGHGLPARACTDRRPASRGAESKPGRAGRSEGRPRCGKMGY